VEYNTKKDILNIYRVSEAYYAVGRAGFGRCVPCVRARRQPMSKGGCGMQIILKKFYQREKLTIWGKNPFGFGLKQNRLTDMSGFSDRRHISRHEI
jgi:hypothetical protein